MAMPVWPAGRVGVPARCRRDPDIPRQGRVWGQAECVLPKRSVPASTGTGALRQTVTPAAAAAATATADAARVQPGQAVHSLQVVLCIVHPRWQGLRGLRRPEVLAPLPPPSPPSQLAAKGGVVLIIKNVM